ncbi:hypothetical protein [Nocardia sp. alder85J]|uniref:hypothetical protein n=1 Tax=Nocardia sp. alder85J TaxID=2862949 RepID=UPI001CD4820F|nr:hypothetical protein [Nocardia sp. alder85J]MCX4098387.1 hypothetical protein [Nocardia sp. alder85J]
MTGDEQHRELAAALHACQATVVLSGYASDLYDHELYPHRQPLRDRGVHHPGRQPPARAEVLWSQPPPRRPGRRDAAAAAAGAS